MTANYFNGGAKITSISNNNNVLASIYNGGFFSKMNECMYLYIMSTAKRKRKRNMLSARINPTKRHHYNITKIGEKEKGKKKKNVSFLYMPSSSLNLFV